MLTNIFGFRLPSGLRRFKESWCWISRQNGKTALNAGIGDFILICDGEPVSEIYAAANTGDQSKITFRDAKRLIKNHPELKEHVKVYRSALTVEDTDACFLALASETSSLDGLRPACLLADEIHEWDAAVGGRELWSKLTSGMVSRRHPLTLAISTAGGKQMGFAFEKFEMIKKILQKVIVADDIWCCAWELDPTDDYHDEKLWIKANPSLADEHGLKMDSLRRQFRETQADPSSLSSFLRYQCGRWQEFRRSSATFPFTKIDACRGFPEFKNADAKQLYSYFLKCNGDKPSYGGFDWGEVSDLACFTLLYPRVTLENGDILEKKVMISEFWTPSSLVAQHEKEWGVPLSQWIRDGWIKTCDGDINSPVQLKKDLLEILNAKQEPSGFPVFSIRSIGYDPWHSRGFMTAFSEETAVQCVEVSQKPSTLTPVAVAFKAALLAGNVWHLGNPVVRWMLSNVILEREGKYDAVVPIKPNKHAKIDAVQAALTAWCLMEIGAPTERAPRIHFLMNDNSVLRADDTGHLKEMYGPLGESNKGPVENDV
jgi:phage terminase large subunit-like protein